MRAESCGVLSLLGVILLMLFGSMFQYGAINFELIALLHGWDPQQKARACYSAAIMYGVTLLLSVVARIYSNRANKRGYKEAPSQE